jgi:hypothetical protein
VSEGAYATAHRHQAGAHVIVIEGAGYALLYFENERDNPRKVGACPYAVVAPKPNEYHQHFNTGKGDYKMLALRGTSLRYGAGQRYDPSRTAQSKDRQARAYMIPHAEEDARIREEYWKTLEQNGIDLRLEPVNQGRG